MAVALVSTLDFFFIFNGFSEQCGGDVSITDDFLEWIGTSIRVKDCNRCGDSTKTSDLESKVCFCVLEEGESASVQNIYA